MRRRCHLGRDGENKPRPCSEDAGADDRKLDQRAGVPYQAAWLGAQQARLGRAVEVENKQQVVGDPSPWQKSTGPGLASIYA